MTANSKDIGLFVSTEDAAGKERELRELLRSFGTVLVAFSGGVDSSYLALIAKEELGSNAHFVTGLSPSVSEHQRTMAMRIAGEIGIEPRTVQTDEMADPHYTANPSNRCYFCKSELFNVLRRLAVAEDIANIVDGTNADDLKGHRPGRRAAAENDIRSPLADVGLTKDEIRERSRFNGLSGWERAASPCLSSRIAYGVPVTVERLSKVERGEDILRKLGFGEFRVRVHDQLARIEISGDELIRALDPSMAAEMARKFKDIGFTYVTLDLEGFRSGAMNEAASDATEIAT